jgi:uncharacterized protein YecT (DUF1311 family)
MKVILFILMIFSAEFVIADSAMIDCTNEAVRNASFTNTALCVMYNSGSKQNTLHDYYQKLIIDLEESIKANSNPPAWGVNTKDGLDAIVRSQKLWEELTNLDCELYAQNHDTAGGMNSGPIMHGCMGAKSEKRLETLMRFRYGWLP